MIQPGETRRGPGGGQYTRLANEPSIVTAVLWDGRVVRMYLGDLQALFVDDPDEWYATEVERMKDRAPA